jgi:N-acetylglucosamine-6-sulfatase
VASRRQQTLRAVLVLATTTLALAGPGLGSASAVGAVAAGPAAASRRKPNILFVLADDLDAAEMRYLPRTRALLGAHGTTFDDYFVSNSLCCPSRTTTLRGQ